MAVLVAWMDDVMILGPPNMVELAQQDLERAFMCKCFKELTKYVGNKLTLSRDDLSLGMVKFTQPVLVWKLEEEYTPLNGVASKIRVVVGQVLVKGDGDGTVQESMAKMYQSATATCMYMMQWSHPDMFNAVHRLARHMTAPREAHVRALTTLIRYLISMRNRGLILVPKEG